MDANLLREILKRSELRTLDFKLQHYDFSGTTDEECRRKRSEFAKDILCMANTPRDESAYIVIGVGRRADGTNELKGVSAHVDDNLFQQKLDGIIYPHPRFQYEQVELDGMQFGVFEILPDRTIGPILPQGDTIGPGGMRRNVLYWRRGSQNFEADQAEQKSIHEWFRSGSSKPVFPPGTDEDWNRFVAIGDVTEPNRHYVLLLAHNQIADASLLRHLAWVDWSLVIDFDPDSESQGVLHQCRDLLEARRSIHRITKGDDFSGNPNRATAWYFCRGLTGRAQTLSLGSFAEWNKVYGEDVRSKFAKLAGISADPVILVALWSAPQMEPFVRKIIESAGSLFGERLTSIIVTEAEEQCQRVAQETGSAVCQISTRHFLEGLATLESIRASGLENKILLPGLNGVIKEVVPSDAAWFEEDLEIVHLGVGSSFPNGTNPERDFLRGGSITWFGLGYGADIEREKLPTILNCVRRDLEQRRMTRVNLLHKPGAGGSTLARRVLWNLRKDFPPVVLRRCVALETVERLVRIYSLCEKPVLILREGSLISDNDADDLAQLLAARHVPSVILQVVRRYSDELEGERRYFLSDKLLTAEAERFRVKLTLAAPERAEDFRKLARSAGSDRTPFIFGLTAFATDFMGLRTYVQNHLRDVPAPQKKILTFLALAHSYGQQAIPEQHFAELLGVPLSRRVELRRALNEQAVGLLSEVERGKWRTAHELVASQILILTLGDGLGDERNWKTRLADLACEFAVFCRTDQPIPPEDLRAAVDRVFYYRNDAELLGSMRAGDNLFSELIGAIPSPEGGLRVFQRIAELFSDSPHYWAHLGRYYSVRLGNSEKAIEAIDRAISLNGRDHILHHMKGMALRKLVYVSIDERKPLPVVLDFARRASECFGEGRSINPEDDHGYISEAQMITRILDYTRKTGDQDAVAAVASASADPWIRESFQKIEDLLLVVRQRRVGQQPSEYEEKCRADLDILYGAHDKALQRWQNLLDRRDGRGQCVVYAPPIRRQIVWAHLARCGRQWDKMPAANLRRGLDLLEENLQEEPADDRNVRLWVQGARFLSDPPSLEVAAERVAYWRTNGDSLDSVYYTYVLYAVQAMNGSTLAAARAMTALEECRNRSRFRRDRTRSFEWFGKGAGLRQLVHQDMLGNWDRGKLFWSNTKPLQPLQGVVASIKGPQAGEIELPGNLRAFFVPDLAGLSYGKAENTRVTLFLGFSYEGLRAWSVQPA